MQQKYLKFLIIGLAVAVVLIIGGYILWQYIYWDVGGSFPRPPAIPLISKCHDTDGGKKIAVLGEISLVGERNTQKDFCVKKEYDEEYKGPIYKQVEGCSGEDCFIKENYCTDKDRPGWDYVPCPKGCRDRVCI